MVQEDNKFETLINMSALCDDTWINITLIYIYLESNLLNGPEIKAELSSVCVCATGSCMSPRRLSQIDGEGVEWGPRDTHE